MTYELHLYISLQPSNDVVFAGCDLPPLSNNAPWWGTAACIDEEEYQQFFPNGYQTAEGINALVAYVQQRAQIE